MEKQRKTYQMWNLARSLVVQLARELEQDWTSEEKRIELKGALRAEERARNAFERASKEQAANHGGNGKEQDGESRDGQG